MEGLRYNYVIFGLPGIFGVCYKDVIELENVLFFTNSFYEGLSGVRKFAAKAANSPRLPSFINRLFACFSYPNVYKLDFDNDHPVCVILFGPRYWFCQTFYFEYIKKKFPSCKFVLYYQDKVMKSSPEFDPRFAKRRFDLIYSYDRSDCEKYCLIYYPTPYSMYSIPENSSFPEVDVFFCGAAKDRRQIIEDSFLKLRSLGLVCDFFINYASEGCPRIEGIHYNEYMEYEEYLQRLSRAKVILDVMQGGADGFTMRLWESMMYGKHLLTNNESIRSSRFYDPSRVHFLDSDLSEMPFLKDRPVHVPVSEKLALSPVNLLRDIESRLCDNNS